MAYPLPRHSILPNSTRHSTISSTTNTSSFSNSNPQTAALQARIASKRKELENLKGLRDLSAQLATQMSTLEAKLATLRDGTESVACILANWDNVLRAIAMASSSVPQPKNESENDGTVDATKQRPELPVTLVRMPVMTKPEHGG